MLIHKGTQALQTPRLTLRPFLADDAKAMFTNWAGDPEVTKYLTWPAHTSVEISRMVMKDWVQSYENKEAYQWAIELKETGTLIGSVSVVRQDAKMGSAEIGYCMGKAWWHQGIMSEAVAAVIEFLFTKVGFNRIEARHDPRNPHSGGVMKKCGMKYEGISRQNDRNNQGICDAAHYAIARSDRKN